MSQLEKAMHEWDNLEINTESPNSADHAISVACNLIAELDSALSKANARISELIAAPSLEAQPAGDAARFAWLIENVRSGSIGFGDWWINADEPAEEWRAAIDAAMAQGDKQ